MKWEKKGCIYSPKGEDGWRNQFAMTPVPLLLGDRLRVFVGFCDENMVGRIGYVDCNPNNPMEVYEISKSPVLDIGRIGSFDDNGVVPISLINENGKILLYYVGFQLGVKVPYFMFGGLAISNNGGYSFERYSESPVLDRIQNETYARCGIYVRKENDLYQMWYVGSIGDGWVESNGKLKPLYMMRYTTSHDGIHWDEDVRDCFQFESADEHGFGRPYVWNESGRYKMLYSIRTYSRGYYIGYAESDNGYEWNRLDNEAGIGLSTSGWDDTNISYPYLFNYNSHTYMFYNGNGCGKSGFGYAELIQ